MEIKDKTLYLSYVHSPDLQLQRIAAGGEAFANSVETLLTEGISIEEVLEDSYIQREIIDFLNNETDEILNFLRGCWTIGAEFSMALWRLRSRRKHERKGPIIEIDME